MLHHEMSTIHEGNETNKMLLQSVVRQDLFADNASDEFKITREDGHHQGIFKVWAAPIIAHLDNMNPVSWAGELRDKPLSLFESLESWRATTARADRDLQNIFDNEQVPLPPLFAVAELFARLTAAFAVSAPFYHIEALVADNRAQKPDNPIEFSGDTIVAGKLDAVAMLLPAAIKNLVIAKPGDWGDLSWEKIGFSTKLLESNYKSNDSTIKLILQRVACLASLDIETVVFAANAIEFIPHRVGGKTSDHTQEAAIKLLNLVLDEPASDVTTTRIAKDMNALIRFLNWTPSVKSSANFSGKNWMYDSVCATAGELLELARNNAELLFGPEFGDVFKNRLIPQLDGIDAMSAKGRFMLQLLHEGKFTTDSTQHITTTIERRTPALLTCLDESQKIVNFDDFSFVSQVGGKAIGLKNAIELFGEESVVSSKIIPVNTVNEWLLGVSGLRPLLKRLELDTENRADIAEQIRQQILLAEPPLNLLESFTLAIDSEATSKLAFRSSSFDEDVDVIGPAPGIYDSVVGIDPNANQAVGEAFKTVVASFFTTKAVHFRDAKGLRHKPIMAVLGQKIIDGPGGSIFIQGRNRTVNIAETPAALNDLSRAHEIQRIVLGAGDEMKFEWSPKISTDKLEQLSRFAELAQSVHGPVDIEFVSDPITDRLMILQLRRLERPAQAVVRKRLGQAALLPISRLGELNLTEEDDAVTLVVDQSDDVDKFQGELFKSIVANKAKIASIQVPEILPPTCHFVNILMTMGIIVEFSGKNHE